MKRILLVGDCGVGKSAFVRALNNVGFESRYFSTIGVQHAYVESLSCTVIDVTGQETYSLYDAFYVGANMAIIMYDCSSYSSMRIASWNVKIKKLCGDIPTLIVGNKSDISGAVLPHFKISAKDGSNIPELKALLAKELDSITITCHPLSHGKTLL